MKANLGGNRDFGRMDSGLEKDESKATTLQPITKKDIGARTLGKTGIPDGDGPTRKIIDRQISGHT